MEESQTIVTLKDTVLWEEPVDSNSGPVVKPVGKSRTMTSYLENIWQEKPGAGRKTTVISVS